MTVPMLETASERRAFRRQCMADDEPLVWAQPGDGDGYALWYDCGADLHRLTPGALTEVLRLFERYSEAPVTAWPRYGTIAGLEADELRTVGEQVAAIVRNPDNTVSAEAIRGDLES